MQRTECVNAYARVCERQSLVTTPPTRPQDRSGNRGFFSLAVCFLAYYSLLRNHSQRRIHVDAFAGWNSPRTGAGQLPALGESAGPLTFDDDRNGPALSGLVLGGTSVMRKFGIMIVLVHLAIVIYPNVSSACSREDELRAAKIGAQSFSGYTSRMHIGRYSTFWRRRCGRNLYYCVARREVLAGICRIVLSTILCRSISYSLPLLSNFLRTRLVNLGQGGKDNLPHEPLAI